jgi:hypothetical protein
VESPGRKELAQDQWLEHDLIAKVVSTFADHALALLCFDEPAGLLLKGSALERDSGK